MAVILTLTAVPEVHVRPVPDQALTSLVVPPSAKAKELLLPTTRVRAALDVLVKLGVSLIVRVPLAYVQAPDGVVSGTVGEVVIRQYGGGAAVGVGYTVVAAHEAAEVGGGDGGGPDVGLRGCRQG